MPDGMRNGTRARPVPAAVQGMNYRGDAPVDLVIAFCEAFAPRDTSWPTELTSWPAPRTVLHAVNPPARPSIATTSNAARDRLDAGKRS
ncbi:hypothetical protein GDI1155 [Gluconacetobacter diazotrophicus PA1 5]|uniref:Uncharacterized protein n=1 Tax=Gluconacetobacter diazotrophicus (strain ATCC 49037 / DSM 5601 / CCUG 37298 / CIP 103539 / LMG 7603 / PAl5) TaxID=272568 RepID=A9HDG5_GLUDA|nr:hypothetical protein GDI1155 [Gluconacetobacter diazotrophicus PA1 5]